MPYNTHTELVPYTQKQKILPKNPFSKLIRGHEENIFLIVGLLLTVGLPLFFLWNPFDIHIARSFAWNNDRPSSVLRAIEIEPISTPQLKNDYAYITSGQTATLIVLNNDTTSDGRPLDFASFTISSQPKNGTLAILDDRSIVYTPKNGFGTASLQTDSFKYAIQSATGQRAEATAFIEVKPLGLPNAQSDKVTMKQGESVIIDILKNDKTSHNIPFNISLTALDSNPEHGTAIIDTTTGKATYTPNPDYFGKDVFRYKVCSESTVCDVDTVTVTITQTPPPNRAPVANNDEMSTQQDTSKQIDVLANDADADNNIDKKQISITRAPSNGTATLESNGNILYVPTQGFSGKDSFEYTIKDTQGLTAKATVAIEVIPTSTPTPLPAPDQTQNTPTTPTETSTGTVGQPNSIYVPDAQDDIAATKQDKSVTIEVLANDTVQGGLQLNTSSLTAISQPLHGTLEINNKGEFVYTPQENYVGEDSFVYQISTDGSAPQKDVAKVTITISAKAVLLTKEDSAFTKKNTAISVAILANDTLNGESLTAADFDTITQQPAHGTATYNNTDGTITYTPTQDYVGSDVLEYRVKTPDGTALSLMYVDIQNPVGPNAVDDRVSTVQNTPVTINTTANDTTTVGSLIVSTLTIKTEAAHGTAVIDTTTRTILYTPAVDYVGQDSFVYQIANSDGGIDEAYVLIDIAPLQPVAQDDMVSTDTGQPVVIAVLENDLIITSTENLSSSQQSGDQSIITILSFPTSGTLTLNADATINYTPNQDFTGVDSFVYQIYRTESDQYDVATVYISVGVQEQIGRAGQVLGINEKLTGQLPRTGGEDVVISTLLISASLILAIGFFGSLYSKTSSEDGNYYSRQ